VRREIRLASDNSWARRHLKHVSWWSPWIFSCVHLNREWQFHLKSNELTGAFWLVLLTEHKVTHCYALNAVCHCLVAAQLYPSWGFSSADCRCFQVYSPCQAIHSTFSVHPTASTDKDFFIFLIRITSSCEIFIILFKFLLIYRSWQFPEVK